MKRRNFFKSVAGVTALTVLPSGNVFAFPSTERNRSVKTKISLNAYSFNEPLRSGEITIEDMIDYAAEIGFDGVDLTGYYFPGYPNVPSDEYIYRVKHKAFSEGVEICGTGVRCNFVQADPAVREAEKKHVKEWIDVASKLGGQTVRVFAGNDIPQGYTRKQALDWVVDAIKECAEYGKQRGVLVAVQNHNDFLKTAAEVEELLLAVNSEWVGLMLDIGSYRTVPDTFAEIRQTIKYAISWQVKEEMYMNGQVVKTDLDKLKEIIDSSGYRGYLPIETLGPGDPVQKISYMYREVERRFK